MSNGLLRRLVVGLAVAASLLGAGSANATTAPILVVDVDSGKVIYGQAATDPWFPASITKLMTTYVALDLVRQGKLSLDTLITISPAAAAEPPSKMGFRPGTKLTLDNALKIIMVKSANDVAWSGRADPEEAQGIVPRHRVQPEGAEPLRLGADGHEVADRLGHRPDRALAPAGDRQSGFLVTSPFLAGRALAQAAAAKPAKELSIGQSAARERQKKCGAEWRALSVADKAAQGPKWPQYYSKCVKRLKQMKA